MLIRPSTDGDARAIDALLRAAFKDHGKAVVAEVARLRSSPDIYIPEMELVAEEAGRVVGFVCVSKMGLQPTDKEAFDALNLTPLAVAADYSGKGIGAALVEAAIDSAQMRKEPLLFVEGRCGPRSLYSRYFEPHLPTILAPPEVPNDEGFQMRRLPSFDEGLHFGQAVYPEAVRAMSD
jgi:predicted N-acetyltransferase YhbS